MQRIRANLTSLSFLLSSIAAGGCGGGSEPAELEGGRAEVVADALTTTLSPIADTYVRDGSSANTNFGSATTLDVKKSTSGYNREAYLRFGLSSFSGTVQSAKLRVYGKNSSTGSATVVARLLRDAAFDESGTTHASKPDTMPIELGRVSINTTTGAWFEFDVTGVVRSQKRANLGSIEFALVMPVSANPNVQFNSNQASSNRPQLVVNTASALFVVGNTTLNSGDTAAKNRLTQLGYEVTTKSAASSTAADATGKSLVVISSTVASGDANSKFRDVAVPVLTWESAIYDDLKMTGTGSTEFGTTASQTSVAVTNKEHALAGGREGTVSVASSGALSWGKPSSSGLKIATISGDATKATVFAYDKGAAMVGINAPARRVGLFLGDTTAASHSSAAWALFDAAVTWVSSSKPFVVKKLGFFAYDPIIESWPGAPRVSQVFGFPSPHDVARQALREIELATGDYVRYQITKEVDVDEWPAMDGTTPYTDQSYLADFGWQQLCNRANGNADCAQTTSKTCVFRTAEDDIGYCESQFTKSHLRVNYPSMIAARPWDQDVSAGTYDEVWVAGPRGIPFFESTMVGPNAIVVNSDPILPPQTSANRRYIVQYLDYMLDLSQFEHAYFHRVEWLMRYVYFEKFGQDALFPLPSNWNTSPYDPCVYANNPSGCSITRRHFLDKFTLVEGAAQRLRNQGETTAVAAVGAAHFTPGASDVEDDNYNYSAAAVTSSADDWLYNFPNLTGESRTIGPSEWTGASCGDACGFQLWLFNHTPRAAGRSSASDGGVLLNWWEYATNFEQYAETTP
jgi:hypothetical protein